MAASCHDENYEFWHRIMCNILQIWFVGVVEPISNAGFQFQNISKERMILERQFVTYHFVKISIIITIIYISHPFCNYTMEVVCIWVVASFFPSTAAIWCARNMMLSATACISTTFIFPCVTLTLNHIDTFRLAWIISCSDWSSKTNLAISSCGTCWSATFYNRTCKCVWSTWLCK